MSKLTKSLLLTLLSLSFLGCAKRVQVQESGGGVDSSGGNTVKSSAAQVDEAIRFAQYELKRTVFRLGFIVSTSEKVTSDYDSDVHRLVKTLFSGKLKQDVVRILSSDSLRYEIREQSYCNGHDEPTVGSAYWDQDVPVICLSKPGLQEIAPEAVNMQTLGLLVHELAHLAGMEVEKDVKKLQNFIVNSNAYATPSVATLWDLSGLKNHILYNLAPNSTVTSVETLVKWMYESAKAAENELFALASERRAYQSFEFGEKLDRLYGDLFEYTRKMMPNQFPIGAQTLREAVDFWLDYERKTIEFAGLLELYHSGGDHLGLLESMYIRFGDYVTEQDWFRKAAGLQKSRPVTAEKVFCAYGDRKRVSFGHLEYKMYEPISGKHVYAMQDSDNVEIGVEFEHFLGDKGLTVLIGFNNTDITSVSDWTRMEIRTHSSKKVILRAYIRSEDETPIRALWKDQHGDHFLICGLSQADVTKQSEILPWNGHYRNYLDTWRYIRPSE